MVDDVLNLEDILTQLRINNKTILPILEYFELNENITLFRAILKNINKETYRDIFIEYLSNVITFHQEMEKSAIILTEEIDIIKTILQDSYDFTLLTESKNIFIKEVATLYPHIKNKLIYAYVCKVYGRLLKYNLTPKSLESIHDLFLKIDGLITNRKAIVNQLLSFDNEINDILGDHIHPLLTKNSVKPLLHRISNIDNVYSAISESIHIEAVHNLKFFKKEKTSKELIMLAKQFTSDVMEKFFMDEHYEQNVSMLLYSSKYRNLKNHLSASLVNRSKDELMSNKTDAEALIYRLILSKK
jgi:hypothetical protein